jgi:hypothetical protein
MSDHSINDPKHWLDLKNADDYERLAQRAKERAAGRWPQSK